MISIIVTSSREPKTIGRAIQHIVDQNMKNIELLVVAPDEQTLSIAKHYAKQHRYIRTIKDRGVGKPAALNAAFSLVRGDIVVLTDGDVFVDKNAITRLIEKFKSKSIGAITGRVISLNSKDNMFGYWAYLLTEGFHKMRFNEVQKSNTTVCSGYLYAVRKGLLTKMPQNTLADDAYISEHVIKQGYNIAYEPEARVFVLYPTNLIDWISQKKRTASRLYQSNSIFNSKVSHFKDEMLAALETLKLVKEPKHIFWFASLLVMRFYIWFRILFDFRLWRRPLKKTWQRVKSTK